MSDRESSPRDILWALGLAIRIAWGALVILTPLLGFWVSSSLATYLNGPIWLSALAGALLFPIIPAAWEWRARRRRLEQNPEKHTLLTSSDRLILRTLFVNLLFLGALLGTYPQLGFTAISTRGDWMLSGQQTQRADQARSALFACAGGLEWLWALSHDNPYAKYAEGEEPLPTPAPTPAEHIEVRPTPIPVPGPSPRPAPDVAPGSGSTQDGSAAADATDSPDSGPTDEPLAREPGQPPLWPMVPTLHPAVANMPASAKRSVESVARYIASKESDPFLRVKALHDFAADHIAYDAVALAEGRYPPQDAETVFRTKLGVCAGYATLLVAMGEVTGDEIVFITGVSRNFGGDISGGGHAWNAAKIEGAWYLIDATWDAGYVHGSTFTKSYSTNYLFTPPSILGVDHLPDDPPWQLRERPLTRGEFMRQPIMRPGFYASGLSLITPTRSQISVEETAILEIENPHSVKLLAELTAQGASKGEACRIDGDKRATITCTIERAGSYQVALFATPSGNSYPRVGQISVNASP
ncbi:MAG: transglutaminase domain-containing protein [Myxococcota bacterium]